MLTITYFQKIQRRYILLLAEHNESTCSTGAWGFHSHLFLSIMTVAREHCPFLGGVRKGSLAFDSRRIVCKPFRSKSHVIRTLLLCDWSVQQSANKPQSQKEKKRGSVVSSRIFGSSVAWHPKKRLGRRLTVHTFTLIITSQQWSTFP